MYLIEIYLIILALFLYYIINYIYRFYQNVKKYPPGPMPIPVIGNILTILYIIIWKRNIDVYTALYKIGHKYGKLFTFWIGSTPVVIILDLETGRNAFNKLDFSDRPQSSIDSLLSAKDYKSFVFQNYTREVQFLRKLVIESIRQVMTENKLSITVNRLMNDSVNAMKATEHGNNFCPIIYFENVVFGTLLELTFGDKIIFGDSQVNFMARKYELFNLEGAKYMLTDFMPITKCFLKTTEKSKAEFNKLTEFYKNKFEKTLKHYKTGSIENICDSMITVREQLFNDGKGSAVYLSDGNLIGVINAILAGATDTSIVAIKWMILLMACFPDIQTKMRNEINEKIGKRVPDLSDKTNCDYVNAFISESMRIRNAVPIGVYHKTSDDITISGYPLPKDTVVFFHQLFVLNNRELWSEPEKFNPNRFLDSSGKFSTSGFPAFIPFGSGRRMCPGDKMAKAMAFLEVCNFLQSTDGYQVMLANDETNIDFKPKLIDFLLVPQSYKIILKRN